MPLHQHSQVHKGEGYGDIYNGETWGKTAYPIVREWTRPLIQPYQIHNAAVRKNEVDLCLLMKKTEPASFRTMDIQSLGLLCSSLMALSIIFMWTNLEFIYIFSLNLFPEPGPTPTPSLGQTDLSDRTPAESDS